MNCVNAFTNVKTIFETGQVILKIHALKWTNKLLNKDFIQYDCMRIKYFIEIKQHTLS